MLQIVTDSTCNLPDEIIQRYQIRVAPIAIQFGEETYEEGLNIDRETFYRKIEEMGIIPTSSQPSPAWFSKYYSELAKEGHSILVITVTRQHSGTYDSAETAKLMAPEADVEIFDSKSISLGTGWMVLEAARAAEEGKDRPSVLARLTEIRERCHLYISPATLKYLQMSGRVGRLQGALGSLLSLKPIIRTVDGRLDAFEKIRTRGKALARILELMEQDLGRTDPVNMAVIHAHTPEEGQWLLERVKSIFNINEMLTGDLVASLAVHGGPGILGIFGYRA
jgi:DegV family protein with EDD domain